MKGSKRHAQMMTNTKIKRVLMAPPSAKLARSYGCVCVCVLALPLKDPITQVSPKSTWPYKKPQSGQEPPGASKPYIPNHNQSIISLKNSNNLKSDVANPHVLTTRKWPLFRQTKKESKPFFCLSLIQRSYFTSR